MKKPKFIIAIALIAFIPVLGYTIMHSLATIIPEDSIWASLVISLIIILVGLIIPYLMLKLGFFAAHTKNRNEKNIHLKDLPKNQKVVKKVKTAKA